MHHNFKILTIIAAGLVFHQFGIWSHIGAKLHDWANRLTGAGSYSWAALCSNDSKTW